MNKVKIAFIMLAVAIFTIGCGSSDNQVSVPFSYYERTGENYSDVIEELEEAGFENIITETVSTTIENWNGNITKIVIDDDKLFRKYTKYDPDVPITITYYELREATTEETEEEENTEPEERTYTANVESLEQLAVDLFEFEYEELSVMYDESDNKFILAYRPVNVSSVERYVYKNINRYIHYCQVAYEEIEELERIQFDVYLLGMDQYGNDYEIKGISEFLTRESFDKFNWENLSYLNIWDAFTEECEYFEIAEEIIDDVDTSKVFYDPYTREDGQID